MDQQLFQTISSLLIGGISAILADWRGRSRLLWFLLGAFLGPLGLLALLIIPKADNRSSIVIREAEKRLVDEKKSSLYSSQNSWFYVDRKTRKPTGPLSFDDLQKLQEEGLLQTTTWVWSQGLSNWTQIRDIDLFRESFLG